MYPTSKISNEERFFLDPIRRMYSNTKAMIKGVIRTNRRLKPELTFGACLLKYFIFKYPKTFNGYQPKEVSMMSYLMFLFEKNMKRMMVSIMSPDSPYETSLKYNKNVGNVVEDMTKDDYYYYNSVIENEKVYGHLYNGTKFELSDLQPRRRRNDIIKALPLNKISTKHFNIIHKKKPYNQHHHQKQQNQQWTRNNKNENFSNAKKLPRDSHRAMKLSSFDAYDLNTNRPSRISGRSDKNVEDTATTKNSLVPVSYISLLSSSPSSNFRNEHVSLQSQMKPLQRYRRMMVQNNENSNVAASASVAPADHYQLPPNTMEKKSENLLDDFTFATCIQLYFMQVILRAIEQFILDD